MKTKEVDRTIPPPFRTIDRIDVRRVNTDELDNGIKLFTLSAGSQEITRIEFIFRAGMYHQPRTLVASCTNSLLESGSANYSASQISEGIDFYGSFLELHVDQDYATVTVFALNKYLSETLTYVADIITRPVFPENEFAIHLATKKQKHAINSQKVNILARRKFSTLIFGASHPYGVDVAEEDFETLNTNHLRDFYARRYNHTNCSIIAAGNLPSDLKQVLNGFFGHAWGAVLPYDADLVSPSGKSGGEFLFERDDAIQSAIRVGRLLFNKTHDDYFAFQVLNTILGGYFGSRLMANIREDKGYTYGIGSGVTNLVHGGYFFISTEVGAEVTRQALDEIYAEIDRLREDLVPDFELETARNYMLGNFLRSVDGPFALADKFRAIWEYGLGYSFYDRYFREVKSVTPARLRELANQYLVRETMIECVVGKK